MTIDDITGLVQSGWTMEFFLSVEEAAELNNGTIVVFPHQDLHEQLTDLVSNWKRKVMAKGSVIIYTKVGISDVVEYE